MALPPGLYSGSSILVLVAGTSAFSFGLLVVYGGIKLKVLKAKVKSHNEAVAKARNH